MAYDNLRTYGKWSITQTSKPSSEPNKHELKTYVYLNKINEITNRRVAYIEWPQ